MKDIVAGLPNIVRKVLDATPIGEAWTASQIISEVARALGTRMEHRAVLGALHSLREHGLVREPRAGAFQRTAASVRQVNDSARPEPTPHPAPEKPDPPRKTDPTDDIGAVAGRLRVLASDLVLAADKLDEAAIAATSMINDANVASDKFRQFQELINSFRS